MPKSEIIDVTMQVHHETERAILVSDDGDKDRAVWLPFSQIEIERQLGGLVIITLPTWLAQDKGII